MSSMSLVCCNHKQATILFASTRANEKDSVVDPTSVDFPQTNKQIQVVDDESEDSPPMNEQDQVADDASEDSILLHQTRSSRQQNE